MHDARMPSVPCRCAALDSWPHLHSAVLLVRVLAEAASPPAAAVPQPVAAALAAALGAWALADAAAESAALVDRCAWARTRAGAR